MINIKYGLSLHRGSKVRYKRHIGVITKSDWRDYAYIKIEGKTYKADPKHIKELKYTFKEISCGQHFERKGMRFIKCETFTDHSKQTWNSVDLNSGTLFYFRPNNTIELVGKVH
jgi:hypothetical protein